MLPDPPDCAFSELPADAFPFLLELFRDDQGQPETLWSAAITGPGVIRIPSFSGRGFPVKARTTWPDGSVDET